MKDRVEFLQFDTCISSCETPIDCSSIRVSSGFPSQVFAGQEFSTRDIPIHTLTAKDAELDLGHIKPTAMLGCEVKLQTAQNIAGFSWLEGFVQGS